MVWLRGAVPEGDMVALDQSLAQSPRPGARMNGLSEHLASVLSQCGVVGAAISQIVPTPRPVRIVAFNKEGDTNWGVPWHQDRVICCAARHESPGFGNWSRKAGVWHCEPPKTLLDQMVFVRVHLDACDAENGAMEIALGSHHLGVVTSKTAAEMASSCETEICTANRGDVQVLNMLLLHRSLPSHSKAARRVLRVDYASTDLPDPLEWAL